MEDIFPNFSGIHNKKWKGENIGFKGKIPFALEHNMAAEIETTLCHLEKGTSKKKC